MKEALKRQLGRDPRPADLNRPQLEAARTIDPAVVSALERLWGDTAVLRRATLVASVLSGARVLWIDDDPAGNTLERQCLTGLGGTITTVESTRSAIRCLRQERFDFLLSDIARPESPNEGLDALPAIRVAADGAPVIFYITELRGGVPDGAFGITNRPDDLLHLCMDAAERRRI